MDKWDGPHSQKVGHCFFLALKGHQHTCPGQRPIAIHSHQAKANPVKPARWALAHSRQAKRKCNFTKGQCRGEPCVRPRTIVRKRF